MRQICPKQKKGMRDENPSLVGLKEGSHLGDGGDVFPAAAKLRGKSDKILDSDCLFHMSSVREHFIHGNHV